MPTTPHSDEWNGVRFVDIILWALNRYGGEGIVMTIAPLILSYGVATWNITAGFFYLDDDSRVDYIRNIVTKIKFPNEKQFWIPKTALFYCEPTSDVQNIVYIFMSTLYSTELS